MKTIIAAVLIAAASAAIAAPNFSENESGVYHPRSNIYTISYDAPLGGHWELKGKRHDNHDGTYTDTFRGTVSDQSLNITLTTGSPVSGWTSDSNILLKTTYLAAIPFSVRIVNGEVTGWADFRP